MGRRRAAEKPAEQRPDQRASAILRDFARAAGGRVRDHRGADPETPICEAINTEKLRGTGCTLREMITEFLLLKASLSTLVEGEREHAEVRGHTL